MANAKFLFLFLQKISEASYEKLYELKDWKLMAEEATFRKVQGRL